MTMFYKGQRQKFCSPGSVADESHSSVPCMFRWVNTWKRRVRAARSIIRPMVYGIWLALRTPEAPGSRRSSRSHKACCNSPRWVSWNREVMGDQSVDSGFGRMQAGWHTEPQPSWCLLTSVLGTPWDLKTYWSFLQAAYLGPVVSTPRPPFSSLCCLPGRGLCVEIEVLQEAGCEFTEEEIVGFVDGPHAPVRVVVSAGAGRKAPLSGKSVSPELRKPSHQPLPILPEVAGGPVPERPTGSGRSTHKLGDTGTPWEEPPALGPAGSRVQRGAVFGQCWLSWVKQVRPGRCCTCRCSAGA